MLKSVFISHAHEETDLAEAWKTLLQGVSDGEVEVWYSSDRKLDGGVGPGEDWRDKIMGELQERDSVLALFTPESQDKPWIFYECAFARAVQNAEQTRKRVIPVTYHMDANMLPSPLQDLQAHKGDDLASVKLLATRLSLPLETKELKVREWLERHKDKFDAYDAAVKQHPPPKPRYPGRPVHGQLIGGNGPEKTAVNSFYTGGRGRILDGEWDVTWLKYDEKRNPVPYTFKKEDGSEEPVPPQKARVWSQDALVSARIYDTGTKKHYYTEGRVSDENVVTLNNWSQADTAEAALVGVMLVRIKRAGREFPTMEGPWAGAVRSREEFAQGWVEWRKTKHS